MASLTAAEEGSFLLSWKLLSEPAVIFCLPSIKY